MIDLTSRTISGAIIPSYPFTFGVKSQARLISPCHLLTFYEEVGRDVKSTKIHWGAVVKNFQHQWKAIKEKRKEGSVETPKISKNLAIIKCSEFFLIS